MTAGRRAWPPPTTVGPAGEDEREQRENRGEREERERQEGNEREGLTPFIYSLELVRFSYPGLNRTGTQLVSNPVSPAHVLPRPNPLFTILHSPDY